MENQHRQINGYRELNEEEIAAINSVKKYGEQLGALVSVVRGIPDVDQRWASIGATDLQTGIMALIRAIAKPTTFIFAFLMLIGCSSSVHHVVAPMESEPGSTKYHYHIMTVMRSQPSFFHAVESNSFMQTCATKIENPATAEEYILPYRDCSRDDAYRQNVMGSVASQFVTPVLTTSMMAGSIAFAGHQIGRGLGRSGDSVTQQGGNSESSASNSVNSGNKTVTTNIKPQTTINSNNHIKVK